MSIEQWVGILVGVSTLVGAFAMSVRHLVKYYLAELKPNGGTSINDKIKNIDDKTNKLESRVDEIYRLLVARS